MRKIISGIAVAFAALSLGLVAFITPAHAATVATNGTQVNQIGILIPYNATTTGPYSPYATVGGAHLPVDMTSTNSGCTWTETDNNATAAAAGSLDGIVYSFSTREFGIENNVASAAGTPLVFQYSGVNSGLCS